MGRFDTYSGLLTAYPYAFKQSDSLLFKSYVAASTLVGALVALIVANALVVLVADTAGAKGGTLTLSRTFYVVVGLAVFLPVVAPVLLVARRHRRDRDVAAGYDRALAAAGYVFVLAVYAALVVSTPPEHRQEVSGAFGPVVDALYSLPAPAALLPPLAAALLVYAVHRRYG